MDLDKELNDALAPFLGKANDKQTTEDVYKVLIPIVRKYTPTIVANDILGVQSMSSLFEPYRIVNEKNTDGSVTIDANEDVAAWIWSQPVDEWVCNEHQQWPYERYCISQELLTMIALKWAA